LGRKKKVTFIPTKYRPVVTPDVMAFPEDVMTGFAERFADVYSEVLESPPYAFYISALTCLGSVLSGRIKIQSELKTDPRLYTILLGQAGVTRKSTTNLKAVEFFRDTLGADFNMTWGVGSAEGLASVMAKGRWNNRTLLVYDEFKQFVDKCKSKGSTLLTCVTELFESNYYENSVKASTVKFDDAHLTILAASTFDTYARCWDKEFTDIGFNTRLFLVPIEATEPLYALPPMVSQERYTMLQNELRDIMYETNAGIVYPFDDYAYDYFESWYMARQRIPQSVRLDTYALRIMTLLTANEHKFIIDIDTVQKAVRLVEWQEKIRGVRDPVAIDNKYAEMEARIYRVLVTRGTLSQRELRQYCNAGYYGIKVFNEALKNLINAGDIAVSLKNRYSVVKNEGVVD